MAPIRKSRTRLRRSGAVAIEYGFVLPVLLLFTFGIIDIGRLLWTFTTLSRATEAAARCAAVNNTACGNSGLIQSYAVGQAFGLDVTAAAFTVTQPACGKQVSATYTFQFVIPWFYGTSSFGSANTMTLSATACYPPQYPWRTLRKIEHQRRISLLPGRDRHVDLDQADPRPDSTP